MASEMLYPVMPIYLKSIGFSVVLIGILEGIAEATAGLSKGYFGKLSDNSGKRAPFIQLGYAMSAVSKPLMAAFVFPLWIFFVRTIDRLGKGIRTGARDAMLSDESKSETKGKVFGFHRALDTLGAVLGPAIALVYLWLYPGDYINLFLIAFIPGVAAIIISLKIKDRADKKREIKGTNFFSFLKYWKQSPDIYRKTVFGLLLFTLFNSSDIFLLLQAKQSGMNDSMVIGAYIFYNLIYALFSFPAGVIADKIGLKIIMIAGFLLFSVVYWGMATFTGVTAIFIFFFVYGIYAASTEGISKALLTNVAERKDTATAIGMFSGFQSICTMLASTLTGFIWYKFGASVAFYMSASVALVVAVYFIVAVKIPGRNDHAETLI